MSGNYIITIGREYGSGGLEIGQKLAEKLGIKCYDKELIYLVAEKKGLKKEILEKVDEKKGSSLLEPSGSFFPSRPSKNLPAFGAFGKTINDKAFLLESGCYSQPGRRGILCDYWPVRRYVTERQRKCSVGIYSGTETGTDQTISRTTSVIGRDG